MDTERALSVPAVAAVPAAPTRLSPTQFYTLWLDGQDSPDTRRAYAASVRRFAEYLDAPTTDDAVTLLLRGDGPSAYALVDGWRSVLRERFAPNTVNVRLSALRALANDARRYGLIDWKLEVDNVRSKAYRDTRGPGRENFRKMREACAGRDTPKARRDTAILRLLHDNALRSKEVRGLRAEDVDREGARIWITGKGRREGEPVTLAPATLAALVAWLDTRGDAPGYLFCRLDKAGRGSFAKALAHVSVWRMVKGYGELVGVNARPHGLRHQGITTALERSGGNIVAAAAFARHKDLNTTRIYDDAIADVAGELARLVAGD